ncbi:MAG: hypothetical protein JJ954_08870 [Hyphomonas sp.]|uniref:hypothetical protein n=1 Tax=Hyphomonas sp. TaxID=87 RepID=UPI001B04A99F|nr:hypothetical protein [Hyphomonas sp.]MBO6583054.1 hypothetical protein [Hyphomonas sp.]
MIQALDPSFEEFSPAYLITFANISIWIATNVASNIVRGLRVKKEKKQIRAGIRNSLAQVLLAGDHLRKNIEEIKVSLRVHDADDLCDEKFRGRISFKLKLAHFSGSIPFGMTPELLRSLNEQQSRDLIRLMTRWGQIHQASKVLTETEIGTFSVDLVNEQLHHVVNEVDSLRVLADRLQLSLQERNVWQSLCQILRLKSLRSSSTKAEGSY